MAKSLLMKYSILATAISLSVMFIGVFAPAQPASAVTAGETTLTLRTRAALETQVARNTNPSFIPYANAVADQPVIYKPGNLPGPGSKESPVEYFKKFVGALARGVIGILGFMAVLFLVYGGMIYITSAGDPEKAKKGKSIFIYSIVGLLLAAFSYAIVTTIVRAPIEISKQLQDSSKQAEKTTDTK